MAEVQIGSFKASVHPDHFREVPDHAARQRLFKMSVQHVVLELSSACNRRCGFCPNADGGRLKGQSYLPREIVEQVISDLASIDYDKTIYWHLYNEPMQDMAVLVSTMKQARSALPKAEFGLNTNGDYLNARTLASLSEAGCNRIFVSIYGPGHGRWDDDYIRDRVTKVGTSIGLKNKLVEKPGEEFSTKGRVGNVSISIVGRNLWKTGYDRGGLVEDLAIKRTSPCVSPLTEFLVDHRGYVLPCCNVYTDRPEHLGYTAGSLKELPDIFTAYAGKALRSWRSGVLKFDPGGPLCGGCSRGESPADATYENRRALDDLLSSLTRP